MADGVPSADEVGGSCDWGGCDGDVVGVRWNDTGEGIAAWLGVCGRHLVDAMHVGALVVPWYALPGGDRHG